MNFIEPESLNSKLKSNQEEEEVTPSVAVLGGAGRHLLRVAMSVRFRYVCPVCSAGTMTIVSLSVFCVSLASSLWSQLCIRRCVHPGVVLRANLKSISHRCYLREIAFEEELNKETIYLSLGCLEGGSAHVWCS